MPARKTTKKKAAPKLMKKCEPCTGQGFALFLVVVGFWWLAQELGWLVFPISIWPLVLIFFGVYNLIHSDH